MTNRKLITNKINEIERILINRKTPESISLYAGLAGDCLFFSELYKFSGNEKYRVYAEKHIEEILNNDNEYPFLSFCNGFSGIGWLLTYLKSQKVINSIDFDSEVNKVICEYSIHSIKDLKLYDFMHSGLGPILHFVKLRKNKQTKTYINRIINELFEISHKDENGNIYWIDSMTKESNPDANYPDNFVSFGLAHGMPSILILLAKANLWLKEEKISKTIENCVEFILSHELINSKSIFPSNNFDKLNSRLAWCYGDLGIGNMLYQLGAQFSNIKWTEKAIEIYTHAAQRRIPRDNSIIDAGICHGTAGVSLLFRRMYKNTKIELFKDTADFWLEETLKLGVLDNRLAGFKTYKGRDEGWVIDYGLLEGVSGIGLVLLSALTNGDINWDECLLLS
ncbi:MAG: lanthionine synthetase C family protein [Bacteroidota bacterium]